MSQKKALIVDDSTVTRLMIRKIILDKFPNCEILEADSADAAKTLVADHKNIDFFSLDQNMPGNLSGLDLAEELRKSYQNTKIILVTANIQDAIKNRAKSIGIDFVEKPVSPEKILPHLD
ncbi:response regulator [Leptospira kanakyensis]|uniref:Response regulator n=1 Tax=Leptospira kanakyensis TaxID=2484968 RepID=A0A6N4QDM2_9LEPT|nr:response regulator [Leptospira kanakyensis]TGK50159.1 response regulator [Leptospira kanakyensis]TGK64240.1 response regulator [Leptospira kanakyensis]TGK69297.1 response regulator [Leptospira kanakyensis]